MSALYNRLEQVYQSIGYYERENKTISDKLNSLKLEKTEQELIKNMLDLELSQLASVINQTKEDVEEMGKKIQNLTRQCTQVKSSLKLYKNAYKINKLKFDWKEAKLEKLRDEMVALDFENEKLECSGDLLMNSTSQMPQYR